MTKGEKKIFRNSYSYTTMYTTTKRCNVRITHRSTLRTEYECTRPLLYTRVYLTVYINRVVIRFVDGPQKSSKVVVKNNCFVKQIFNTYAVTNFRSRSFTSVKTISVIYYTVSSQSVGTEETSAFTRIFSKCKFQSFDR